MVDNISIMDQVYEVQILVSKLKYLKVEVPESFQVGAIIAKLPSKWNDYRKKLLHTIEAFFLKQIQEHLHIEEKTRKQVRNFVNKSVTKVKNAQKFGRENKRNFSETSKFDDNGNNKKGKACYNCRKKGHYKRECRFLKKQRREELNINVQHSNKTNLVEQEPTELIAMLSKLWIEMLTQLHMASISKTDEW